MTQTLYGSGAVLLYPRVPIPCNLPPSPAESLPRPWIFLLVYMLSTKLLVTPPGRQAIRVFEYTRKVFVFYLIFCAVPFPRGVFSCCY